MQLLTKFLSLNFISNLVATYIYLDCCFWLACTSFTPRVFLICISLLFDNSRYKLSHIARGLWKTWNSWISENFNTLWGFREKLTYLQCLLYHTFGKTLWRYLNRIAMCIIQNTNLEITKSTKLKPDFASKRNLNLPTSHCR